MVKDLPAFLVELGKMMTADNSNYEQWIALHHEKFAQLLDQYTSS